MPVTKTSDAVKVSESADEHFRLPHEFLPVSWLVYLVYLVTGMGTHVYASLHSIWKVAVQIKWIATGLFEKAYPKSQEVA